MLLEAEQINSWDRQVSVRVEHELLMGARESICCLTISNRLRNDCRRVGLLILSKCHLLGGQRLELEEDLGGWVQKRVKVRVHNQLCDGSRTLGRVIRRCCDLGK